MTNKTNTVLLSIILALMVPAIGGFGWVAKEAYAELRSTHDAVIKYDVQITDLRARVAAVEVEIQKLKERKP